MLDAAVQAGHPANPDLNGAVQDGVGRFQLTQRGGFRCSTADAYLQPALERPNLEVRDSVYVERIVFDGDRAVGVDLVHRGVRETVRAEREVILSAGAYQSPVLLMLSGIGLRGGARAVRHPGARGSSRWAATSRTTRWRTSTTSAPCPRSSAIFTPENFELLHAEGRGPLSSNLPGGGRLLPHAARSAGAGRRVPLLPVALLRRGPHGAARPRLRVRAGAREADRARHASCSARRWRTRSRACSATSSRPRRTARRSSPARASRSRWRAQPVLQAVMKEPFSVPASDSDAGHPRLGPEERAARLPPDVDVRDRRQWSTPSSASTGSRACASSTRPSCRRSRARTRTRRR